MPNLIQLIDGTSRVLPVALENWKSSKLKAVSLKQDDFVGVKTKQFYLKVLSSKGREIYTVSIFFYPIDFGDKKKGATPEEPKKGKAVKSYHAAKPKSDDVAGELPDIKKHQVRVRCSCLAYYFWFIFANKLGKALAGGPFKPYRRKTPPSDPRYPPKNPRNIPGVCKHIIFGYHVLEGHGLVK